MSRFETRLVSRLTESVVDIDDPSWRRRTLEALSGGAPVGSAAPVPFGPGDATAGSETELQAVVIGNRHDVDLPLFIEQSKYYRNLLKRAAAQDMPRSLLRELHGYLHNNRSQVWEQSWVRFPRRMLCPWAQHVLELDLRADKTDLASGPRDDYDRFFVPPSPANGGQELVRVPVSYLLKLALADVIGVQAAPPRLAAETGDRLLKHFLNDNISPETFSFYVVSGSSGRSLGRALAKETSLRFLLTQVLTQYANERFELRESGQQAVVYFSPHPPIRQKQLNESISDSFYRELFTSPCLSGWDHGQAKHDYMQLCHQVLTRSQLQAVAKVVRDAGLIAGRLVRLPNLSNISLANNGIHVSLGSRRLDALCADRSSGFGPAEEKYVGDLVIKVVEHFLPLFVGTYSGSPYRLDFADFHAERVLGFLPHQLDFTHLRMMWRRWKKKARVKLFGQPLSPMGYDWIDNSLSKLLHLRGDFVADFRLLDYLVAPLSTHESPALDGRLGNAERLKHDLADQGMYDERMSLYMLYRQRAYETMGYSGFEGRYYSLCESLENDLGRATELQNLITALAYQYVMDGRVTHADIPDDPHIESERRQIFFGAAAGIPTFFVRQGTKNRLLQDILKLTRRTRASQRYPGYVRVYNQEFRRALLALFRRDAAGLIESHGAGELLDDLDQRIADPTGHSAAGKLTRDILDELGVRSPFSVSAEEFNGAAEKYYRETLRKRHMREAFRLWREELRQQPAAIAEGVGCDDPLRLIDELEPRALRDELTADDAQRLANLLLATIGRHHRMQTPVKEEVHAQTCAPVC